eukprot:Ihof_evm10s8 gene=Ihof_evmTU10s8
MKKAMKLTDKVGQWTGEKLNRFDATKLEEDFVALENHFDATDELLKNVVKSTEEYLQPNPSSRSKLSSGRPFPQPEEMLADVLTKSANSLPESTLSEVLGMVAQGERDIGECHMHFDTEVMMSMVKPMNDVREKEIKDLLAQRKKLDSRRLDYDAKRRTWEKRMNDPKIEEEFRISETRYEDIKELAYNGMLEILENEPEYTRQLLSLVQAQMSFYKQALDVLIPLVPEIQARVEESKQPQRMERYHRAPSIIGDVVHAAPPMNARFANRSGSANYGRTATGGNTPPRGPVPAAR